MTTTMTSKANFYRRARKMMVYADFKMAKVNDKTIASHEEMGFNYDVIKYYLDEQEPFYVIQRATAPYKYDDNIFGKGICKQSVRVDMIGYKWVLSSYSKMPSHQTCILCCNADGKKCNFSFCVDKHNKMNKHIKNVRIYVETVMDATKLNYDACNLIMSYLYML